MMYEDVYLVSDKLVLASDAEIARAEQSLSFQFPAGYREFVTTLGEGIYSSHVFVYLPDDVLGQTAALRTTLAEHASLFKRGYDVLPEQMLKEMIALGSTVVSDYILWHPARPHALYVLPRHDPHIYEIGHTVPEALTWLVRSNVLVQAGVDHVLTPSGQFVEREFRCFESTMDRATIGYGCRGNVPSYPAIKAFLLHVAQARADEATLVVNSVDGEDNFTSLFLKSCFGVVSCNPLDQWGSEVRISYDPYRQSECLTHVLAYLDLHASFRSEVTETGEENVIWERSDEHATSAPIRSEAQAPPMRILHFPPDHSVGALMRRLRDEVPDSWAGMGEAQGAVTVPASEQLGLWYALDDLSPLAALGPDDLYSLNVIAATLRDDELAHIQHLTGLRQLYLSGFAAITDAGLIYLQRLQALEELSLDGTGITDAGLRCLGDLAALRVLDLSLTGIIGTGLAHLSGLTALRELDLSDSNLDDAGIACLPSLGSLRTLRLRGAPLTDAALVHLAKFTSLKHLNLTGTRISAHGLAALERELPQCRIYQ